MTRLVLELPSEVSTALDRASRDVDGDLETVAVALLRDALRAGGWLEPIELDEDSETEGSA